MNGLRTVITLITLASLALSSCRKELDAYSFTIRNDYFESLTDVKMGMHSFSKIAQKESTSEKETPKGEQAFSANTESGLVLSSTVNFTGKKRAISLVITAEGKLAAE